MVIILIQPLTALKIRLQLDLASSFPLIYHLISHWLSLLALYLYFYFLAARVPLIFLTS